MKTVKVWRVIGLAIALEAVLFVTLVPLISRLSWTWLMVAIAAGCAIFGYAAGWLVARGMSSGAALHGLLIGLLATVIYFVLNIFQPGGIMAAVNFYGATIFVTVNGLKIAACVAGAVMHRADRVSGPAVSAVR